MKNLLPKKRIRPLALILFFASMAGTGVGMALVCRARPEFIELEVRAAVAVFTCAMLIWLLSIPFRDVSLVDIYWPLGFLVQGVVTAAQSSALDRRQWLLVFCLGTWSLRLAGYLIWRKVQEGGREDSRYNDYVLVFKREIHSDWLVAVGSVVQPFALQAFLIVIIGSPIVLMFGQYGGPLLDVHDLFAFLLWCVGFAFEAGGDFQLARFKAEPSNHGKVLEAGFFAVTRHPNYFGDGVMWLAYWTFSVSHTEGLAGLLVGSPVLMYILLRYVSGVEMLDNELRERRPNYKDYMMEVSPFFPCPRRKAV